MHGYLARELGEQLTAVREDRGLSQRAQARELDIAGTTLRELERGLANPTLARIEELAESLDVTVEIKVQPR